MLRKLTVLLVIALLGSHVPATAQTAVEKASTQYAVSPSDNTRPAGQLEGNVLTVRLFAGVGSARPAGPQSVPIEVAAFGEEGADLSAPAPLIRVREGTTVVLTLRNTLGVALRVHGLCARPGPCDLVSVAPAASQEIRFKLDAPGTYLYWATTGHEPLGARTARDTQLGGAIVVDPREGSPADRVFVISTFGEPPPPPRSRASEFDVFAINGLSWPHTEKLHHKIGDRVRWRIINLSFTSHPMHLHGFYFVVEATGDISAERRLAPDWQRTGVTECINIGRTFVMSWTPEAPGNWLFHCHMTPHMSGSENSAHAGHGADDSAGGMAGLVLGIYVVGDRKIEPEGRAPRKLSMVMREEPNRYGKQSGYRFDVDGVDAPRLNPGPVPGPVLVLTRGEPVEITLVNQMPEPTAIHWHGIELDSYYDGVPGFGGSRGSITPAVDPGRSFVAKFTPPRAGTFIYHTHWHNDAQLAGGLYGPLIVLEPGERTIRRPITSSSLAWTASRRRPSGSRLCSTAARRRRRSLCVGACPIACASSTSPLANAALTALLFNRFDQMTWIPVAKDGATLPPRRPPCDPRASSSRSVRPTTSKFSRRLGNCCGWKCADQPASGWRRHRSGFARRRFYRRLIHCSPVR